MSVKVIRLQSPFSEADVRKLRAGDMVAVHGTLFTGRDRLHQYLAHGGVCPVELRDGGIFHCGPIMRHAADGAWQVVVAGPTTSTRQEPYMRQIITQLGPRVIIGKGGMGAATRAACREYGCVYLQAVGGAAALIARRVTNVAAVYLLEEFGPTEALWQIEVAGIEAVVGIDSHGESLYEEVRRSSKAVADRGVC